MARSKQVARPNEIGKKIPVKTVSSKKVKKTVTVPIKAVNIKGKKIKKIALESQSHSLNDNKPEEKRKYRKKNGSIIKRKIIKLQKETDPLVRKYPVKNLVKRIVHEINDKLYKECEEFKEKEYIPTRITATALFTIRDLLQECGHRFLVDVVHLTQRTNRLGIRPIDIVDAAKMCNPLFVPEMENGGSGGVKK